MPEQLVGILVQLPVVAVFVWYSDRLYRQFQEFLREERAERARQLSEMSAELRAMNTMLIEHDRRVVETVAAAVRDTKIAQERTEGKRTP
jgi:hypothetical protein